MAARYAQPQGPGPPRDTSTGSNYVTKVRRPPALSAARILAVLAVVAIVVIAAYVGVAIYSATMVRASSSGWHTTNYANEALGLTANATIQNPGFFAVTALDVEVAVGPWPPCGNGVLHATIVQSGTIPGQGSAVLPITIQLPAPNSCDYSAKQPPPQKVTLNVEIWSNATYAGISNFTVHTTTSVTASFPTSGPIPAAVGAGDAPAVGGPPEDEGSS
jgi:hypothetical protein